MAKIDRDVNTRIERLRVRWRASEPEGEKAASSYMEERDNINRSAQ